MTTELTENLIDWKVQAQNEEGYRYPGGNSPSVAISDNYVIVSVAENSDYELVYTVGYIDPSTETVKGLDVSHSFGTNAEEPDVAISANGSIVVEVSASRSADDLYYRVGFVDSDRNEIQWGDAHAYGTGKNPSIVLSDDGKTAVAVGESDHEFYYRIGKVEKNSQTITWSNAYQYGSGSSPEIAMDDQGNIISVAGDRDGGGVYYRYGQLSSDQKTITWSNAVHFADNHGSPNYYLPSVAMSNDGSQIVVTMNESNTQYSKLVSTPESGIFASSWPQRMGDGSTSTDVAITGDGKYVVEVDSSGYYDSEYRLGINYQNIDLSGFFNNYYNYLTENVPDNFGGTGKDKPMLLKTPYNVDNVVFGGEGNDQIFEADYDKSDGQIFEAGYDKSDDQMFGYDGNDYINGGEGSDSLYGGQGIDVIVTGNYSASPN